MVMRLYAPSDAAFYNISLPPGQEVIDEISKTTYKATADWMPIGKKLSRQTCLDS
jgi:hypothetical protein